jgi:tRNA A-37 threonylcarbamoyl transferase component Bud32
MSDTEDYRPLPEEEERPEDARLMEAVQAYQAALDAGARPSRREFLARYPEVARELADALDGLEFLHSAASRLRPPPVLAAPLQPDGTLGDFRLVREIGRGAMGVVYEAMQLSLQRRVALKVLPLAATLDPRQSQRFENEARAAAHLHHANIVPVFAVGCERGVHYYAMQLIEGRTLAAVIDHLRQTPRAGAPAAETVAGAGSVTGQSVVSKAFFRTAATLGAQAADALEYAHQMGVVHRDVKPANLLLDGRGNLWVTDFGLARFQSGPGLTSPGDLVGTLRYMSPEQVAGKPVIDPRSDVYALGVTLYELLTQRPAFPGRNRQECLRQILDEEPVPPRRLNKAIPPELETIVLKAMAKHPEDRYGSARELADDLRRFRDDQPVQARRPGLGERAARWAWRHGRVVSAAVLGLLVALPTLAAFTWRVARAEGRAVTANEELRKEQARALAANEELRKANRELKVARGRAAEALKQEQAQRGRAEGNYQQARRVLDYLTQLGVEELGVGKLADKPQLRELRRRLLSELLAYHQEFIDRHADDPSITDELIDRQQKVAELLDGLGKKAEAMAALRKREHYCQRLPASARPGFSFFGGPFAPPRGLAPLLFLAQPAVQKDLKLSAEQRTKVAPLVDWRRPHSKDSLAAAEKTLAEVLRPEQKERLNQIIRRSRGPHALLDPEAALALGLTEEQKGAIQSLLAKAKDRPGRGLAGPGRGMRRGKGPGGRLSARGRPPGGRFAKGGRLREGERKQLNEQALQVLTPGQRGQWEKMLGPPFRGEYRFGPPRPHGGRRGH